MTEKMKIMFSHSFRQLIKRRYPDFPKTIPFESLESFRKNIEQRHGQTLERLNERGGLSPGEIYMGVHNIDLSKMPKFVELRGIAAILDLLESPQPKQSKGGSKK